MDRMTAALAGLLHDIGKFWQRAASSHDQPLASGYEAFKRIDAERTNAYGAHGAHATWSAAFIERYVPEALRASGYAALYHHNPQDHLSKVVALADRLASGERVDEPQQQPRSLLSIFCQVGEDNHPGPAYFRLRALSLDEETLFPVSKDQTQADAAAYQRLWDQFEQDAQRLRQINDAVSYIESVYHLLYRYTWCVPAAFYRSVPDISLFDHSRVTAALAACLVELDEVEVDHLLKNSKTDKGIPLAYLIEGDISGVQKFIYTLTSKGAAKGLRGRSFYLQLLTEAIARFILRDMELPITNLIYIGGGHFYLLVPPGQIERLNSIQRELDELMLDHHEGALYVALGEARLCAADFQAENFSSKWREAGQAVGRAKRRRFAEAHVSAVFGPRGHGGNEEAECQVCHVEGDDVRERGPEREGQEPVRKCGLCASFEELGRKLGKARYLVLGEISPQPDVRVNDWEAILSTLGIGVGLFNEQEWLQFPGQYPISRAVVLGLHDFASQDTATNLSDNLNCPVAAGVRYTANVTPYVGRDVATFEDMQEAAQGLKQIGVLRMDVDDLGLLFSRGFEHKDGKNLSTLARVASLSSMLALYFEGWVGELCQRVNTEAKEGRVYTIYSGGDDLFIVGAWDVLPGLACAISRDLYEFAAHNPRIHASAGITLHGGKYPLYQAAQDAASALADSKDWRGKNAITFLGQTTPWDEWATVVDYQVELVHLVKNLDVGRSLLHVLQQLYRSYQDTRKAQQTGGKKRTRNGQDQIVWGPHMWHSAYLLTRLAGRVHGEAEQRVLTLRNQLSEKNFQQIQFIGLAARWAEALTRSGIKERM
jgi:CRISPR-associated protein Csm1